MLKVPTNARMQPKTEIAIKFGFGMWQRVGDVAMKCDQCHELQHLTKPSQGDGWTHHPCTRPAPITTVVEVQRRHEEKNGEFNTIYEGMVSARVARSAKPAHHQHQWVQMNGHHSCDGCGVVTTNFLGTAGPEQGPGIAARDFSPEPLAWLDTDLLCEDE